MSKMKEKRRKRGRAGGRERRREEKGKVDRKERNTGKRWRPDTASWCVDYYSSVTVSWLSELTGLEIYVI